MLQWQRRLVCSVLYTCLALVLMLVLVAGNVGSAEADSLASNERNSGSASYERLSTTPHAEEATRIGTIYVPTDKGIEAVRVRAGSDQNTEQIGMINPGEYYECMGVAANGWYEIKYPTGRMGFVSNKLVEFDANKIPGTFSDPLGKVMVIGGSLKSYTGPKSMLDRQYAGSIDSGQVLTFVGKVDGWYAVVLPPPKCWVVYVFEDYVSPTN